MINTIVTASQVTITVSLYTDVRMSPQRSKKNLKQTWPQSLVKVLGKKTYAQNNPVAITRIYWICVKKNCVNAITLKWKKLCKHESCMHEKLNKSPCSQSEIINTSGQRVASSDIVYPSCDVHPGWASLRNDVKSSLASPAEGARWWARAQQNPPGGCDNTTCGPRHTPGWRCWTGTPARTSSSAWWRG